MARIERFYPPPEYGWGEFKSMHIDPQLVGDRFVKNVIRLRIEASRHNPPTEIHILGGARDIYITYADLLMYKGVFERRDPEAQAIRKDFFSYVDSALFAAQDVTIVEHHPQRQRNPIYQPGAPFSKN